MLDNQEPCIKKCDAAWYSRCQIIWYSCCTWNQMNRDSRWWEADPEQGLWFHRSPEIVCRKGRQVTKTVLIPLEKTLYKIINVVALNARELFSGSSWCSTRTSWISRMSSSTPLKQFGRRMTRSESSSTRYLSMHVYNFKQTRKGTYHLYRQTWWPTNSWWGSTGPCSGPCQRS